MLPAASTATLVGVIDALSAGPSRPVVSCPPPATVVITPAGEIFRTVLLSTTNTFPDQSIAIEPGWAKKAALADPPSPDEPSGTPFPGAGGSALDDHDRRAFPQGPARSSIASQGLMCPGSSSI